MSLTALDYEEIKQLHTRYSYCIDFEDVEGLVSIFTSEGTFTGGGNTVTGTEQLRKFVKNVGAKQIGHCRHTVLYSLIDGDGQTARSVSYATITRDYGPAQGKGQVPHASLLTGGIYIDSLVREDGRWKYASRKFLHDGHRGSLDLLRHRLEISHVDAGDSGGGALTALDYEAIRQLAARYCYCVDFGDFEGLVECFAPGGGFGTLTGENAIVGRERLLAFGRNIDEKVRGHAKHACVNIVIEGDSTAARVSSYGYIPMDYGTPRQWNQRDNSTVGTTGVYKDEVVKLDGRWLFKRRTFSYDGWTNALGLVSRPLDFTPFN
jgi:hypothetical protein